MGAARSSGLVLILLFLSLTFLSIEKVNAADISADEDCPLSAAIIAANNDAEC